MKSRWPEVGVLGWVGLILYVLAFDLVAMFGGRQTLSAAFYKASLRRAPKAGLFLFWGYLTAHLFRWMPARVDAFRVFDRPRRHK